MLYLVQKPMTICGSICLPGQKLDSEEVNSSISFDRLVQKGFLVAVDDNNQGPEPEPAPPKKQVARKVKKK